MNVVVITHGKIEDTILINQLIKDKHIVHTIYINDMNNIVKNNNNKMILQKFTELYSYNYHMLDVPELMHTMNNNITTKPLVELGLAIIFAQQFEDDSMIYSSMYKSSESKTSTSTLSKYVFVATSGKISLKLPFGLMSLSDIVEIGIKNNAPMHLSCDCVTSEIPYCGKCLKCIERQKAFADNNFHDPLSTNLNNMITKTAAVDKKGKIELVSSQLELPIKKQNKTVLNEGMIPVKEAFKKLEPKIEQDNCIGDRDTNE